MASRTNAEASNHDYYSETISEYDLNGNIKALQRKKSAIAWDYGDDNRRTKVTDSGTSGGFNNGGSGMETDCAFVSCRPLIHPFNYPGT